VARTTGKDCWIVASRWSWLCLSVLSFGSNEPFGQTVGLRICLDKLSVDELKPLGHSLKMGGRRSDVPGATGMGGATWTAIPRTSRCLA
jgi:hypothetical protein